MNPVESKDSLHLDKVILDPRLGPLLLLWRPMRGAEAEEETTNGDGSDGEHGRFEEPGLPPFFCFKCNKVEASRRAEKCRSLRVKVELRQCACACVIGDARACEICNCKMLAPS